MKNALDVVLGAMGSLSGGGWTRGIPAWAAELRLTGYLDSAFPHFQSNVSPLEMAVTVM